MKSGKLLRLFAAVMAAVLLAGMAAAAETDPGIQSSRDTISDNRKKIQQLEGQQRELKSKIDSLSTLKADTASMIAELDQRQKELDEQSQKLSIAIEETETRIEKASAELAEAAGKQAEQQKTMGLRIKYIYEFQQAGTLETLFSSGSVAELLNNIEYIQKINRFDRSKLEEYKAAVKETAEKKEALESEKSVLEEQKKTLDQELEAAKLLESEKQKEIDAFESQITSTSEKSRELAQSVETLNAAIKAEEQRIAAIEAELRRREEEARKKAEAEKKAYVTQSIGNLNFLWPVPSSGRITSYFGDREAPVEGASTKHKGIDIGASTGEKVLAAESGTVVIASYSGSAGNYVMISHGGGIYTVYMHLSSIAVSEDREVSRGETIGYVGSTGYSTGPHLHFGIRIDGSYSDPLAYVSP